MHLKVAFDAFLPVARWAPLFHVLCLEQAGIRLAWRPLGFPTTHRPLLDGADVGLFAAPPAEAGLAVLTVDTGPMAVTVAVGHRLARHDGVTVAEILEEPFVDSPDLHPQWRAFWTLAEQRGRPAASAEGGVLTAARGAELVASGAAIATVPAWAADGLAHPGVITVPLLDGPEVHTRMVWRAGDDNAMVRAVIDLAAAWTATPGDRHGPHGAGTGA
jgi:DNA-binding transcriptional LysR family regulator